MARRHVQPRAPRRLGVYGRTRDAKDLDDILNTFEVRVRTQWALIERRIARRRRALLVETELHADPMARYGSRKPSLNEYEGHE